MKIKNTIAYIVGGACAVAVLLGMIMFIPSKAVTITAAIVTICLCLVTGMLFPNPISLIGLVAGICMLIFPGWIVGVVLVVIGAAGAVINAFVSQRYLKKQ